MNQITRMAFEDLFTTRYRLTKFSKQKYRMSSEI